MSKFYLYLFRWQLSTPILWYVIYLTGPGFWGTVLANLIGGCVFFFVDKWIFAPPKSQWVEHYPGNIQKTQPEFKGEDYKYNKM